MGFIYTVVSVFILVFGATVIWMITTENNEKESDFDMPTFSEPQKLGPMIGLAQQLEEDMYLGREKEILTEEKQTNPYNYHVSWSVKNDKVLKKKSKKKTTKKTKIKTKKKSKTKK